MEGHGNAVVDMDGDDRKIRSGSVSIDVYSDIDASIVCDSCDMWYHVFCVGFDPKGRCARSWLCPRVLVFVVDAGETAVVVSLFDENQECCIGLDKRGEVSSLDFNLMCALLELMTTPLPSSPHIGTCLPPQQTIFPIIPQSVNFVDLCDLPSRVEVKEAIFRIYPNSVSGPDGYSALFFKACWEIIETDVEEAVVDFFSGHQMSESLTATSIIFIPKRPGLTLGPIIDHQLL
ncbi:PHD finger protein-related [Striga asiatica]|uniref:PHD finger protein-related n=1 Tax=Striga asiatica TaxID=4170 RepID=A0A5A7QS35_STRAF|nr:PHD finger protein-related [Striga asiatica]